MHIILIKPASGLCNMRCDYCFYCDESAKRERQSYGFMSEETIRNIIEKVLNRAKQDVCFAFQGGEPTLCGLGFFEKVIEFENIYNKKKLHILNTIQTNGFHIDENWCRFLKGHDFLVGVSVDGTEEDHDRYRHTKDGMPTYRKIHSTIELFKRYEIQYNILTVVNSGTAENIKTIYREYKKNGWNYQQYITCLDPLGEENGMREYSLTPEAYGSFLKELFDLWYKDWRRGKMPYIRQFENYIGILLGYLPESCEQRGICSVQGVTEADGSVYPCDFYVLDQYRLGNYNADSIPSLFQNETAVKFVEESREISPVCTECRHYDLCRGGCRRSRIKEESGDTYRSYYCESYKTFFDYSRQRLEEIAKFLSSSSH